MLLACALLYNALKMIRLHVAFCAQNADKFPFYNLLTPSYLRKHTS